MKKLMMMIALAACAAAMTGCSVKKIEYEKNDKGEISYRIYENDHWLKTESTGIRGGMTQDGRFEFEAEGMKSSPSEEFNRTMQTYTTAFVQLAQIAAAAYNPSSSAAVRSVATVETAKSNTNTQSTSATATEDKLETGNNVSSSSSQVSSSSNQKQETRNQEPTNQPTSQTAADCKDCTVDPQATAK